MDKNTTGEHQQLHFRFINSLGRQFNNNNISTITFDISRYGEHTHKLTFANPMTEQDAIGEVEKWLSVPLTQEYFDAVKNDLFCGDSNWHDYYKTRGDLLGNCKFLERIRVDKCRNAKISCGS